jgi:hypothetical protein
MSPTVNRAPIAVTSLPSSCDAALAIPATSPTVIARDPSLDTCSLGSIDCSWEEMESLSIPGDAGFTGAGRGLRPGFLPPHPRLDRKLTLEYEFLRYEPKRLFSFVARNTNPHRLRYSLWNLFANLGIALRTLKFSWVLQRNCVPCVLAVDKTLSQFADGRVAAPRFYQVAERRSLSFCGVLDGNRPVRVRIGERDTLAESLTACVPSGQRACISVPVRGRPCFHALNVVHMPSGERYVLCGQQRRVYSLDSPADVQALHSRYGVAPALEGYFIVALTGSAPRMGILAHTPDMLRLMA